MLVFSFILYTPSFVIATFYHKNYQRHSTFNLPSLLHIPNKFGPISNCILVALWFYNQFLILCYSKTLPSSQPTLKSTRRIYHHPSLHHLLFFIYVLLNCSLVHAVAFHNLPMTSLSVIPSLLSLPLLRHHYTIRSYILPSNPNKNLLLSHTLSTNYDKLCYLSAWQSIFKDNPKLMDF
jgi:hypothetical protein